MRLWITGVGVVSPLGAGAHLTMDRLCDGARAIGSVSLFDVGNHKTGLAAQVADVPGLQQRCPAGTSRTDAMAIAAAREALAHAGIRPAAHPIDLIFGTTTGATFEVEDRLAALFDHDIAEALDPALTDTLALSTELLSGVLGPFRRARSVSSACSTGAIALVMAAAWIRSGRSDRVLAGSADGLCRLTFTGFNALGSLDPHPCRPFDRSRAGLSLGEGAGFVVLERDDAAKARGASPIAELAGWCAGAEAHHVTNPEPHGTTAARLTRRALEIAGLDARSLDYVNAHGTATLLNDPMEIGALRAVLGDEIERVDVSSTKGQIGHTLGAAGTIEAVVTALAIQQQRVPPTGGLTEVGDDCRARHVLGKATSRPVRAALSNSFGFGGLDAVLLMSQPGLAPPQADADRRHVVVLSGACLGPLGLLDTDSARAYLEPGPPPAIGAVAFDEASLLDVARTRRLGRAERMLVACISRAFESAGGRERLGDAASIGLVASRLSGNPGPTARFLAKARDKGPRFAPPADFPNLMLSALAGHASIYHRIEGPTLATTERNASAAASFMTVTELLEGGCAGIMIAGSTDDWDIVGRARQTLVVEGLAEPVPCTEGASCLLLCEEGTAACSVATPIARVLRSLSWHDENGHAEVLRALPAPPPGALVLLVGATAKSSVPPSWRACLQVPIEARAGHHEAGAGTALVAAVSALASSSTPEVLVVATGARAGFLFLLGTMR